jgi:hypothetical protein
MIAALLEMSPSLDRPVLLCFYGDHSPILGYDFPHDNPPVTDYFIHAWPRPHLPAAAPLPRTAHDLPHGLLSACAAMSAPASDLLLPA